MVEFFKRFRKKEPVQEESPMVRFGDLHQWLDEKELEADRQISEQIIQPRDRILSSIEDLIPRIDNLTTLSYEDKSLHPKLKRTIKHSIPAFVTAMNITVQRNLSEDPGEFYDQIVEILKTYQKSMKSHGKYVAAVFPEEMKGIRQGIDTIGRELNTITEDMAQTQEELKGIAAARSIYKELKGITHEYRIKHAQWEALWKSIPKDEERLKDIERQVSLLSDTEAVREVERLKEDLHLLEEKKKHISHEFSLLMTSMSNVVRKVEYIAQKEGNRELISEMNMLRSLLDHPESSHFAEIKATLAVIVPQIMKMIERDDVVLKNKSERALFSEEGNISAEFERICRGYFETKDQINADVTRIELSEELKRKEDLEEKAGIIRAKHKEDIEAMTAYECDLKALRSKIPPLIESLQTRINDLEGKEIELKVEDSDLPLDE